MAKYYSSTIQKGSQGNDVKQWQDFLRSNGFSVSVDGIFGDETETATKEWQTRNGLGVDGIVGEQTWGKAGYSNANNSVSAPNTNPLPTNPTYDTTSWDSTQKGQGALNSYNSAKDAVNGYGDFSYDDYTESDTVKAAGGALNSHLANKPGEYQSQWQSQLDQLMNSIMNREKFSYDLNSDALYQQYKDKYVQQGKLAMSDAIGQASAMTGGYGNSYAQAVGQQQYQASLDNLNDIVPELYAMALDQYNREGQDLYNQYGMVADRENLDYGRYRDTVSDWNADRDYLSGRYDTERGFDYGKYVDDRNMDYTLHQDAYNRLLDSLGIASDDYYKGADMFYTEQGNKNNVAGQQFSDAMNVWNAETDQAWKQAQWDEAARQYALAQRSSATGSGGSGGSSGSGGNAGNTGSQGNDLTETTSGVSDSIRKKLDGMSSNTDVETYLENLEASGAISHDQALQLMSEYMDSNEVYVDNEDGTKSASYKSMAGSSKGWSVVDDGGTNWWWGVDGNAIVKSPNGEQIRLDNLVDKLVGEGMSKSDAKDLVKKLQKNLGI